MFAHPVDARTELRLLQQQHAPELFAVVDRNRDHLRAWLPWVDATTTVQDSVDFIVMSIFTFAQQGPMTCGIWHDGLLCGVIGHNDIDPETGVARLGYWLSTDVEGRGVMTACVRAFLDHAFDTYGLEAVELRVATENRRSLAIPERLGFERGGILVGAERLHDRTVDHRVHVMTRARWLAARGA
jgi:ribosomal-protein-serine acetyltransferase